jgi:hypothetical protein
MLRRCCGSKPPTSSAPSLASAVTAEGAADLFALFQTAPVTIVEPDDALKWRAIDLAFAEPPGP